MGGSDNVHANPTKGGFNDWKGYQWISVRYLRRIDLTLATVSTAFLRGSLDPRPVEVAENINAPLVNGSVLHTTLMRHILWRQATVHRLQSIFVLLGTAAYS